MKINSKWLFQLLITFILEIFTFPNIDAQSLTWLGTLGGDESQALDISSDGSVVVGWAKDSTDKRRAFRWTSTSGMEDLGTLGGPESIAYGVSSDGSVIVGTAHSPMNQFRAFRWIQGSGMQEIADLAHEYEETIAKAVSGDGSFVVGSLYLGDISTAFIWSQDSGLTKLGTFGGKSSAATDISKDGKVVVGFAQDSKSINRAFIWDRKYSFRKLIGTEDWSIAYGVSGKEYFTFVVGEMVASTKYPRAFRCSPNDIIEIIGSLGEKSSVAYAASEPGYTVVGSLEIDDNIKHAFRWEDNIGIMEDLNNTYKDLLPNGSYLAEAFSITPDARYIAGYGFNALTGRFEGFLLDTKTTAQVGRNQNQNTSFQVYPNPITSNAILIFSLLKPTLVRIELISPLGELIETISNKEFTNDIHTLHLNFNNRAENSLATGIYFIRFITEEHTELLPIMILK